MFATRVYMTSKRASHKRIQPRKTPLQTRSAETVVVILEAAARILETRGFDGFNTNAIAERAGVSIGSLYQYFSNKDAILSGLIERELAPLLAAGEALSAMNNCRSAIRAYISSSICHQMKRPRLASLIDIAENRNVFWPQVSVVRARLQTVIERILMLPGAPNVNDRKLAASDILAIVRNLVDAAGERGEAESPALLARVEAAVWGYFRGIRNT